MASIKTRTKRLHDAEAARWRAAWEAYYDVLFRDPAVPAAFAVMDVAHERGTLTEHEQALDVLFEQQMGAEAIKAWEDWLARSRDLWLKADPATAAPPDLSRWPHLFPEPPPVDGDLYRKALSWTQGFFGDADDASEIADRMNLVDVVLANIATLFATGEAILDARRRAERYR